MRRAFSLFVGVVAFGSLAVGTSCSSTSDKPDPSLADVVYEGQATDEGLTAILAAKVVDDPTRAANFSWQSAGDELPLSPIPLFCWHIGSAAARREVPAQPRPGFEPLDAPKGSPFEPARPRTATFFDAAKGEARSLAERLLSGVPSAYAHGTPMSGPGFLLVFSTSKNPKLLRVFTTGTEYTPNQAAWQRITTTGELVHVQITNAELDQNRIAQDGGPYRGSEISFTFPAM